MTGWRAMHGVMATAGLDGPHASPKGLRHGFGVAAVTAGIPLNLWPSFRWSAELLLPAVADARFRQGRFLGTIAAAGLSGQQAASCPF